jgi:hypothetical protein
LQLTPQSPWNGVPDYRSQGLDVNVKNGSSGEQIGSRACLRPEEEVCAIRSPRDNYGQLVDARTTFVATASLALFVQYEREIAEPPAREPVNAKVTLDPACEHFTALHPGAVWLEKSQHAVSSVEPLGTSNFTVGFAAATVPPFFTVIVPP